MEFTKDYEFSSPSAAASVIMGCQTNGLINWINDENKTLKKIETIESNN